jgi:putative GTP pyrophosphokinase
MIKRELERNYKALFVEVLQPAADVLEAHLKTILTGMSRIDKISARAKSPERFFQKAYKEINGKPKYGDPINEIQDQIGARIVTYYLPDVEMISKCILKDFRHIERQDIEPESDNAFGYFGKHFVLYLPTDVSEKVGGEKCPTFFELQIKTLFQHAWSEAEHDLGYKPSTILTDEQRRKIAFTAAQSWGADMIFEQLIQEVESNGELSG